MAYRKQISREELLILVGMLAPMQGNWTSGTTDTYAVICKADLDFVRERSVIIRRYSDGSVRVALRQCGKPTI